MAVLGLNKQDTNFSSNVEMKSKSFGIGDASAIIDILRNRMYSMPIQTLVQEYICNGRDASIEASSFGKKAILITAPTKLACEFRVRDFGVGLSQERVENVFTLYGNSTKRNSNTQIGGYGLGAKSAWAYTDSFTVVSFYNGTKTTYLCHVGKDNVGSMDILNTETTKEANGVEIVVTVKPEDITKFTLAIKRVLSFWNEDSYKLNIGFDKKEPLYKDSLVTIFDETLDKDPNDWKRAKGVFIVVDDVIFPIPKSLENKINHNAALYIHLKTGEVDVAPSREVIIDNNKVTQILHRYNVHLANIKKEIESEKVIDNKVILGDKYQPLIEEVFFKLTDELNYKNGCIETINRGSTRRLTNKNRKLVVDTVIYDYDRLSKNLNKKTIILIADNETKNIPSKVIHNLSGTKTFERDEYAILLPKNNLPKFIADKVTVLEVESLPLPPKVKSVKYASSDDCKEISYSYSRSLISYERKLADIKTTNSFKVLYHGWKDNYKLSTLLREENDKVTCYALKKDDYEVSKLPTMDEYIEAKAKIERKKIGNLSDSNYQSLSKLVNDVEFPNFGSEPKSYYLNEDERKTQAKYVETANKMLDNLRKEFPLLSHLSYGNMKELAEYMTLKQKSKVKNKKSA